MLAKSYLEFCETLWSAWVRNELEVPPELSKHFQLDHVPEPYLCFGAGSNPLYVLTTNPGGGMEHQKRDVVLSGKQLLNREMSYSNASTALADYYEHELKGAARTRIKAMRHLQELLKKDGVVQLETIPFHSANHTKKNKPPQKNKLLELIENTPVLEQYAQSLSNALQEVSVIALSGASGPKDSNSRQGSISVSSVKHSKWLMWQAKLMGLDVDALEIKPLVEKEKNGWTKTTCAILHQKLGDRRSGFVLMMGSNSFPGPRGSETLANTLSSDS